jgi:hypothetical protein
MTGQPKDSQVGKLIVSTFWTLKHSGDFEGKLGERPQPEPPAIINDPPPLKPPAQPNLPEDVQLRVGYTINLNLPETTNPEVFNAIFKSLKEHLLRN